MMKLLYSIIFCWFAILTACNHPVEPVTVKHRLIHNNDGTEILGNNWFGKRPLTPADVNRYVDMIANSQVTTFMICSGSDFFYYRSKYGSIMGDDKNGQLNCGKNTELYNTLRRFYHNAMVLDKEGTDIVEATLKRAKEKKLEAFITYRMNDLHFADTSAGCPLQYGAFWKENPRYWTNDTTLNGWNARNALDFAHPEVREYKLNIIKEQFEKYGALIDGYELDFMRFIVYFKKDQAEKNASLITELVQAAKNIADSVGKLHNKKILLTARIPPTISDCRKKGLDVQEWVKLGLIDFLTLGVHWRGEPAMPVAEFKKQLGLEVPVYATLDDGTYNPREAYSHGMYRGMASHAMAQGAGGIYLFNYFLTSYNEANQKLQPKEGTLVCRTIAPQLLQELGSLETLRKRNKIYALSDGASSYDLTSNSPLPLRMKGNVAATIFVGDDVSADEPQEVILFIRTNTKDSFSVSINGSPLQHINADYPRLYDKLPGIKEPQNVTAFIVPANVVIQGNNKIVFSASANELILQRVELALKYGSVEECGYF
ncbi:glycoside hydrolase family 10 protein [Agriterribacter humi]|uniref:hypothetical protein n=1 Tax=Agriterribacter humi TaxID=1104781 RepID=UPI001264DB34|nr:hypothetical protein [Agriterribacter humi]